MEDSNVATRAPESDVLEDAKQISQKSTTQESVFPGDTPAQTGASLGEHCVTDRPTLFLVDILQAAGEGSTGDITQLGGVDTYISKPVNYPHTPAKLLLLLTAATGLHSANNQIQADHFAREGFLVVMPDMFGSDPLPGSATYQEDNDPSLLEQIKLRAAETAKSFLIDMWLARQTPEKVLPILHKVIDAAKDEFADAVANGGGIYSAGYCFGGRMTLLLAGEKDELTGNALFGQAAAADEEAATPTKKGPYIKAGAVAHATLVTRDDFVGTKVPLTFVCVENDQLFEEDIRSHGENVLKTSGIEANFKTYQGVPHGFGVVGEYQDSKIQGAQKEAFEQILSFLQSH